MSFDIFEMTGLAFDPPDVLLRPVQAAITKLEKDIAGQLGSAVSFVEQETLNAKLAYISRVKEEIFTFDGKRLTEDYARLAQKRAQTVKNGLKTVAETLRSCGISTVTRGTVRIQKTRTKLSEKNVEAAYREAGFTITEPAPLAALPAFPLNAERIHGELNALRSLKDPNPNGANLSLVTDMYAFTAYLMGEPQNAAAYRRKTRGEIVAILDRFASQLSTRTDSIGKLCASLTAHGKTNIFFSDANRRAYEAYLVYISPGMSALFDMLKGVARADLLNPRFADACIKRIAEGFGDAEVALALYNSEAELRDEPYRPSATAKPVVGEKLTRSFGYALYNENDEYVIENLMFVGDNSPCEASVTFAKTGNRTIMQYVLYENIASDRSNRYVSPPFDSLGNEQYADPALKVKQIGVLWIRLPQSMPSGADFRILYRCGGNGVEAEVTDAITGQALESVLRTDENCAVNPFV